MRVETEALIPWFLGILGAGVTWLVRRVLTNEKQIAILEAEARRREEDVKEMKQDIKVLLGKHL